MHIKTKVTVRPWKEVEPQAMKRSTPLLEAIANFASCLNEEQSYVYEVEFGFGEKLIENGSFHLDRFDVSGLRKNTHDFRNDLSYSLHDPLGLVLENHMEIYVENNFNGLSYPISLGELYPGDFFGVFGALGYLSDIEKSSEGGHWSVIAGNICIEIAFNWEKGSYTDNIEKETRDLLEDRTLEGKRRLLKKLSPKGWKVKVIYFPKQFLGNEKQLLKLELENELYRVGWKQANPLKDYLLDNKVVFDAIFKKSRYKNDRHFLCNLYNYIYRVGIGERKIMKPISKDHIGYKILENLRDENPLHFNKKGQKVPLFFKYDYLTENDWGLISLNNPPILFTHGGDKLDKINEDIKDINSILYKGQDASLEFEAFTRPSELAKLKKEVLVPAFSEIHDKEFYKPLKCKFEMVADSIVLTESKFKDLLLIKRK